MNDRLIGNAVMKLLDDLGLHDVRKLAQITACWREIVGDGLVEITEPVFIREGILHVQVSNHSWAQELHMLKPKFIEKINSTLGDSVVRDLRFKVRPNL